MKGNNKYALKKMLAITIGLLLASGAVVLLMAAISKDEDEKVNGVEINISGVENNFFLDKIDVLKTLEKINGKKLNNVRANSLDLTEMEKALRKDEWIKSAELFFDNNKILQVNIIEREPIARIFTTGGVSFFIDSSLKRLPLSDKFSPRLPVFTDFPTEVRVLKKQDSILLNGVKKMSEYINLSPFWMAQIDQIDITPEGGFELIPKLGNQIIRFGAANDCEEKFNKLFAFYKQIQTRVGWNQYSVIDLQYKNQVIGVKRDAQEIKSDSLRSIQIMKDLVAQAQKNANDSTKIQLPQPQDTNEKINTPMAESEPADSMDDQMNEKKSVESKPVSAAEIHDEKPSVKKEISTANKPVIRHPSSNEKPNPAPSKKPVVKKKVVKPQVQKPPETDRVPKAVMPSKSDY